MVDIGISFHKILYPPTMISYAHFSIKNGVWSDLHVLFLVSEDYFSLLSAPHCRIRRQGTNFYSVNWPESFVLARTEWLVALSEGDEVRALNRVKNSVFAHQSSDQTPFFIEKWTNLARSRACPDRMGAFLAPNSCPLAPKKRAKLVSEFEFRRQIVRFGSNLATEVERSIFILGSRALLPGQVGPNPEIWLHFCLKNGSSAIFF